MKKKKIKEKQVDAAFSLFIRERDGWTCQARAHENCLGHVDPPTNRIQNSHYHGRDLRGTRFDLLNCDTLCDVCHSLFERTKTSLYYEWKLNQLGPYAFEALRKRTPWVMQFRQPEYKEMIERFNRMTKELVRKREGFIFGKH